MPIGPSVARRLLRYELGRLCARSGMTQADMGARLGVSRASFTQLLSGKNLLSQPALEVIAYHVGEPERLPKLLDLLRTARSGARNHDPRDTELAVGLRAFASRIDGYEPASLDWFRQAVEDTSGELRWVVEQRALSDLHGPHNVAIRVTSSREPTGAFQIIRSDDGSVVAVQETLRRVYYYDTPEAVADYVTVMERLWNDSAVGEQVPVGPLEVGVPVERHEGRAGAA